MYEPDPDQAYNLASAIADDLYNANNVPLHQLEALLALQHIAAQAVDQALLESIDQALLESEVLDVFEGN